MLEAYGLIQIPSSFIQLTSVVIKCDSSYLAGKVKSKNFPVTVMKARRSSTVTAPPILNLGIRWK
jgi:hypothetical protein